MPSSAFQRVLQATGYLDQQGRSAPGFVHSHSSPPRLRSALQDGRVGLRADAAFTAQGTPISLFKDAGDQPPAEAEIKAWHQAAWNIGVAPLLWIVTPTDVRLYDCYGATTTLPDGISTPKAPDCYVLDSPARLRALDAACGRLATETGAFWSGAIGTKIDRRHRVDRELLAEIAALEQCLIEASAPSDEGARAVAREVAQRFIGRCIFTWYLLDRHLAQPFLPLKFPTDLADMFATAQSALALFEWLRTTFNGDLFPMDNPGAEQEHLTAGHLKLIRDFIEGWSLIPERRGQGRFFRFRFNAIPVDLISSIYQQFARSSAGEEANKQGLHYTPVELVHLTLDPVFEGLDAGARVLDPTCGSGAFLVEAFRRLVWRASGNSPATREMVRRILYGQLYGIDINPSALGIAAFSLYLTALELDEEPITDPKDLKFDRLINRTLFEADTLAEALPAPLTQKPFDAVVGNPPWTFVGRREQPQRQAGNKSTLRPRRSPDQAFLSRAADLAGDAGRIGMIMKATPFFAKDKHAVDSREALLERLAPVALINLSYLRREELFPDTEAPALLLFSRCLLLPSRDRLLVGSIPWTREFRRTGIFHIGPGEIRPIPLNRVLKTPPFLKAVTFGTVRDGWLIEKLEKSFPRLDAVLDDLGLTKPENRGQGFQVKGNKKPPSASYFKLKVVTPQVFTAFRLDESHLLSFAHKTLHFQRRESIFNGPLLICSKASNLSAAQKGRYSAAVHLEDVLYTQSSYGISFRRSDVRYAYVLSAILNSSLTAFQLAMGGSGWGLGRPTVTPKDLLFLRVPSIDQINKICLDAAVEAEHNAAADPRNNSRLDALDEAVADLYDLEAEERVLLADAVARARYMIFEGGKERGAIIAPPSANALRGYASQVTATVNAYLRARGERHLKALVYDKPLSKTDWTAAVPGMTAVRFIMHPGPVGRKAIVENGEAADMVALVQMLRDSFVVDAPPYLNERRQLRIYGENDLFVLKPCEMRYWTLTAGLNDADVILADHWIRRRDAAAQA